MPLRAPGLLLGLAHRCQGQTEEALPLPADDDPLRKAQVAPERFLKHDVTFEHLNALAMQLSIFSGWAGTIIASGTTGAEQHRSKQLLDRRRRTYEQLSDEPA